jgi:hypothetical protein
MAKDSLKKEILNKVLNTNESEKKKKILDSELNEVSGGKDAASNELEDSCKCGLLLACA